MCNCAICNYGRIAQEKLAALPEDQRLFFTEMFSRLTDVEAELDYRNCIIDGSNSDADRIIAHIRQKRDLPAEPNTALPA